MSTFPKAGELDASFTAGCDLARTHFANGGAGLSVEEISAAASKHLAEVAPDADPNGWNSVSRSNVFAWGYAETWLNECNQPISVSDMIERYMDQAA